MDQAMATPRSHTKEGRESRLRYYEDHREYILATLHYEAAGDGLSDDNKLRLTDAYLDIQSDDTE